jgi:predicted transcriptional regulator
MVDINPIEPRPRRTDLPALTYGTRGKYTAILQKMNTAKDEPPPRRRNHIRRSDIEVYMDIMTAIKRDPIPTRIMYGANVSWAALNDRVEFLIRANFVTVTDGIDGRSREEFYLTESGVKVLTHWTTAMDILYEALGRVLKT